VVYPYAKHRFLESSAEHAGSFAILPFAGRLLFKTVADGSDGWWI
jgi:hypothetical protein